MSKPQIREFPFNTQLFENYQRSEKALLASICQMVTDGVSTGRVRKIVAKLSPDLTYSKSTVSRITQELDPQIKRWQEAQLQGYYQYLFTDALYFYVRVNHEVVSCPVLVSIGVDKNGYRKILGIDIAFEESHQSYLNHFSRINLKVNLKSSKSRTFFHSLIKLKSALTSLCFQVLRPVTRGH